MIRLEMSDDAERRINKSAEAIGISPSDVVMFGIALIELAADKCSDGGSIVLVEKDGGVRPITIVDANLCAGYSPAPTMGDIAKATAQPPGGAIVGALIGTIDTEDATE